MWQKTPRTHTCCPESKPVAAFRRSRREKTRRVLSENPDSSLLRLSINLSLSQAIWSNDKYYLGRSYIKASNTTEGLMLAKAKRESVWVIFCLKQIKRCSHGSWAIFELWEISSLDRGLTSWKQEQDKNKREGPKAETMASVFPRLSVVLGCC